MVTKKSLLTTVALGAAYLLRNKETRDKLMSQFKQFAAPSTKEKA
ncbi:hypothetical protein [Paenibacillus mucilaginosus]|uniref:Uncharacterized protein n=3 Tax=Paenibacillus mucilaginosus TaxID=61624 RepID=H6NID4_9BACL|nr:hypothetical protein [Paenibacillus mucilaginosus]AEI43950.1 hypothetical protein KNP414_05426 [Paenibacillus mucilaginosus KNP414]AFC31537.1 hypothetical protein PM3016_4799 [Paenibacillus mucilaginosus 3016]AFH63882.1 hypothetical protein B2K_24880 [Paenibacillus mucilaginosus K02]